MASQILETGYIDPASQGEQPIEGLGQASVMKPSPEKINYMVIDILSYLIFLHGCLVMGLLGTIAKEPDPKENVICVSVL